MSEPTITFKVEGRTSLGYSLGKIYTIPLSQLTPLLERVLRADKDLRLLDPLTIDDAKALAAPAPKPEPEPPAAPAPKVEEEKKEDGESSTGKSSVDTKKYSESSRSRYGDRAKKESGERSKGSTSSSSDE